MTKFKKVELLSPVGSKESMIAALNNGCDAIYLGGKDFNARQSANNFTNEELKEIIDYCHKRGVKVNLTLNILYKETEIQNVLNFVSKVYSYGIDAIIVQDIGIFNLIKNNFPNVSIHASTQMTIHNLEGVKFLQNLGFKRVVLSRELSLEEIEYITQNTNIEIEAFVHGAICVSYSGRCLMSSLIGERSGNRGRCAQPCRMEYKLIKNNQTFANNYLLSPKDTSTLPIIDKLVNSGIHTFKIEGRMKNPEYVASVTSNYRKYIDKVNNNTFKNIEKNDLEEITQIFNRGGSSITGYYLDWAGNKMISQSPKSSGLNIGVVENYNKKTKKCEIKLKKPVVCGDGIEIWTKCRNNCGTNISKNAGVNETINITINGNINKGDLVFKSFDKNLDTKLKKLYQKETRQQEVKVFVYAKLNKPLKITLSIKDIAISCEGEILQKADKSPVSSEKLIENLSKTGGSPFYFIFEEIDIDENIYIAISAINNLRRAAIEKLENAIIKYFEREYIATNYKPNIETAKSTFLTVLVQNKEQFNASLNENIKRIYLEMNEENVENIDYFIQNAKKYNIEIFVAMLWIFRKKMAEKFYKMFQKLENSNIDGYLLRNYMNLNTNKKIALDYTFNVFNNSSIETLLKISNSITISPELNLKEISSLSSKNTEVLVYGKLPLMTTHQCPVGIYVGEKESGRFCKLKNNCDGYYLKDRKNVCFPIKNDCFNCTTTILNNLPLFTLNKPLEFKNLKNEFLRISFIDEKPELIKNILKEHINFYLKKQKFDLKNTNLKDLAYTNGHFFRGVL